MQCYLFLSPALDVEAASDFETVKIMELQFTNMIIIYTLFVDITSIS